MNKIDELLERRIETVYPSKEVLAAKLKKQKIRLYQGFDPTSPNLHIGHLVGLLTLRDFQKLGHEVIFLVGDFTGQIGDPTDKKQARSALSEEEVAANAKTYQKQVSPILSFSGRNAAKIIYNSSWNKKLSFGEVLNLAKNLTVQQLIERDMFQERLATNREIYLNEFIYPLVQGYDSVALKVDLEIGGTDQLFNMMIGRKLVSQLLGREKMVATTKLLTDSAGKKIGKTEGNAVNLNNPPDQFYGQLMSLTDESILPCLKLITDLPLKEVSALEEKYPHLDNPMPLKKKLAFEVTKLIHGQIKAVRAQEEFEKVYQRKESPGKYLEIVIPPESGTVSVLISSGLFGSNSQIKRLIQQGGVEVNGRKISAPVSCHQPGDIIKAGKHHFIQLIQK